MPCNPNVGGSSKGHLVREIDALDGLMGRVIDQAGIQFRMLNRSKGPAVRGPRSQADRKLYRLAIQDLLRNQANLTIKEGAAASFICALNGAMCGICTELGEEIRARAIVVTTGTFLRGLIHLGEKREAAGRVGEAPSVALAQAIAAYGLRKKDFIAVIQGMEMDARGPIVAPSLDELDLYCDCVAAAVGLVFGDLGSVASIGGSAGAVRNAVRLCGIPLADALRMASATPARFLNVDDRLGRLAPGYAADMVALTGDLAATAVWRGGVSPG